MNKAELVAAMAEKTGMKKNDAEKALKAFVECCYRRTVKGEKIQLVGLVHLKCLKDLKEKEEILEQVRQ